MTLGEKLFKLRRENNYTQEQLAGILGVSRQSISKWEQNAAFPETDKLIRLSELYDCSLDYLLRDKEPTAEKDIRVRAVSGTFCYEKKSSRSAFGLPLWHINIGWGRTATGIFAFGLKAKGVVAVGVLALGLVSAGCVSVGALAVGTVALGILAAGSVAVGVIAAGAVCLGLVAAGALANGWFAAGALALGKYFAAGDHAVGQIALGQSAADGSLFERVGALAELTAAERARIAALLDQSVPAWLAWAKSLILLFL